MLFVEGKCDVRFTANASLALRPSVMYDFDAL
jgi:hypothetical protein